MSPGVEEGNHYVMGANNYPYLCEALHIVNAHWILIIFQNINYFSHFADEEMERNRSWLILSRSQSLYAMYSENLDHVLLFVDFLPSILKSTYNEAQEF